MASRAQGAGSAGTPHRRTVIAAATLLLSSTACKSKSSDVGAVSSDASAASTVQSGTPAASADDTQDEVLPVYPPDHRPPLPIAEAYCKAIVETPRRRREECCPAVPALAATNECIRTLSAALRSGAVTLSEADVEACKVAYVAATADCDWVQPAGDMPPPAACLGILKGTLEEKARCRSNLECKEGLRCAGLGATRPGRCAPPDNLHACNISRDSLASFSAQTDVDRHHPECAGYCAQTGCREATTICTTSVTCGPAAHCIAGKCSDGALPGPGRACSDVCADGAHCAHGTCVAVRKEGEPCERDAECRVLCEKVDGATVGRCARSCPSFPKAPGTKGPTGRAPSP